ncbi:ABC transporter ATP-binding protein [Paraflavitalea pollutisoli]|uniref:ABC transporter ATP-binding protein n=1 Tax=Paraflavitalea pollutisoli TaxID=3034143 RepID=UPI0023EC2BBB|nr:ATP-binding cassette domain-containing protein [Paraflavitalea sp. H1-2-19X]
MHTLEATQLTKQYQGHTALNGLNLSLQSGDIFCLLGQNGAGKTTTLNIFLGFLEASSGEARIMDIPVTMNGHATRQYLAYIPEVVQLYPNLTGIENLDFFSRLAGFTYSDIKLQEFLLKAGLQETAHRKRLQTFSKGMRQKVGIAIALAKNAQVIFMDEPTSGLDPKATQEFTAVVKELGQEGKTVLMATHDLFNAVQVGTRIGIMKAGHLVHTAPTSTITADALQQLYLETI